MSTPVSVSKFEVKSHDKPDEVRTPDKTRIEVVRRARPVIDELDEEYADNPRGIVVVVAHGGMIAGLVCGLLGLPISTWPSIGGMANCHWAALARRAGHPRWRLAGYNVSGIAAPPVGP